MLEATGKDQRHASRTLRVADSGERDTPRHRAVTGAARYEAA
jgi:hypothetical protein